TEPRDRAPNAESAGERGRTLARAADSARIRWATDELGRPRRDLCGHNGVDYRFGSHVATISPVARGCSAVGSASPCQGEGRGFESRHPLEGCSRINPRGGVAEW